MRKLFFIREVNTNTWCTSTRSYTFHTDFDRTDAFFNTEANATKAMRTMERNIEHIRRHTGDLSCSIPLSSTIPVQLEVVAFELNEVLK